MEYEEFVSKFRAGELNVHVDRNKAGYMYNYQDLISSNLRSKQFLIRAVGFIGLISGIILFFFVEWFIATLILIVGLLSFPSAQKDAANGVLKSSLDSKKVYNFALNNNVIKIESKYDSLEDKLSNEDAETIVKEYANTIEHNSPLPLTVSDTKNLPYSKNKIKKAILVVLQNTTNEQGITYLKHGYTFLSNWQDNVGDEDIGVNLLDKDLDSDDASQHIQDFQEQSRKYNEWKDLVESEEKQLIRELEEQGF